MYFWTVYYTKKCCNFQSNHIVYSMNHSSNRSWESLPRIKLHLGLLTTPEKKKRTPLHQHKDIRHLMFNPANSAWCPRNSRVGFHPQQVHQIIYCNQVINPPEWFVTPPRLAHLPQWRLISIVTRRFLGSNFATPFFFRGSLVNSRCWGHGCFTQRPGFSKKENE